MAIRALIPLIDGQRVVNLPFGYIIGSDELYISLNGKTLYKDREYTEVSVNAIELASPAEAGEVLEARILTAGGS
jgi:hypothetical protein